MQGSLNEIYDVDWDNLSMNDLLTFGCNDQLVVVMSFSCYDGNRRRG